jgi:hypothetical protein
MAPIAQHIKVYGSQGIAAGVADHMLRSQQPAKWIHLLNSCVGRASAHMCDTKRRDTIISAALTNSALRPGTHALPLAEVLLEKKMTCWWPLSAWWGWLSSTGSGRPQQGVVSDGDLVMMMLPAIVLYCTFEANTNRHAEKSS